MLGDRGIQVLPVLLAPMAAGLNAARAGAVSDEWEAERRRATKLLTTAFRRLHAEADGGASEQMDRSMERPALAPVPLSGAQLPEPEGRWRATTPMQQRGRHAAWPRGLHPQQQSWRTCCGTQLLSSAFVRDP